MNQDQVDWALGNPDAANMMLDRLDAEDSLLSYIKLMWSILEPGRRFVSGRAVDALCDHLEAVSRGDIKRLVMNVPPGMMKSLTTDVFWPSWEWGPRNNPWRAGRSCARGENGMAATSHPSRPNSFVQMLGEPVAIAIAGSDDADRVLLITH